MSYCREYQQEYYAKNRKRILAVNRAWEKANPDKVRRYRAKMKPKWAAAIRANKQKWERQNPRKLMLKAARDRARRDGHDFAITIDHIVIPEICPLLGIKLVPRVGGCGPQDNSPSLDRKDNTRGYVPGNVRVISWLANRMKFTATSEQLRIFAQSILGLR